MGVTKIIISVSSMFLLWYLNRCPNKGMECNKGTLRCRVDSLDRITPPMTAVSPLLTISLVSTELVRMMMPPDTVASVERSDTSGFSSIMIC